MSAVERAYDLITGEEEDNRVCDAIPESACTEVPRNFFLNVINGMGTKLADQLANPGLVLPWFLDALGAPASVIGFLTPVRRAGALLPQLAVAGYIRQFAIRKWFWLLGGTLFGLGLVLMVPTALFLPSFTASILIVVLLAFGSLSRGISSVAFKDVLAKTIPMGRRGRLLAMRATLGGGLALAAGVLLRTQVRDQASLTPFLILVGVAGVLWIAGALLISLVKEEPGATEGGRNAFQEARAGFSILRTVPGMRQFVLTRSMLLTIELSLPFYSLFARRSTSGGGSDLGIFVIAASLSQVLSSPLWGRLADRTSRVVMMLSAGLAALAGLLSLVFGSLPLLAQNPFAMAIPVLLVGFAIAGVRLGRKTYIVDGAPEEERPLYFALTNTITGILTLVGGGLGFIADLFGLNILIAILVLAAIVGIIAGWRLPEAENLTRTE